MVDLALPIPKPQAWYANLTVQILVALVLGVLVGWLDPAAAASLKPLGDVFVRMIKMVIGPIIFLTVVTGIAGIGDMRKVGRIGLKTIIYFEVVTTLALALGLLLVNVIRPGSGFTPAASASAAQTAGTYATQASKYSFVDFLVHIVPDNAVGAFVNVDALQILFFAVLFGAALIGIGEAGRPVQDLFERLSAVVFGIVSIVIRAAPIGAFGAIAFTVGTFGLGSLAALAKLILAVYVTLAIFVVLVLGLVARLYGFRLSKLLSYLRDELLITVGCMNSESVFPRLVDKLTAMGCSKAVVGLVLPTGYSMNQDGTMIYLAMSVGFIAQAYNVPLSLYDQLILLVFMMFTSKGVGGVQGAGFVILASTLAATGTLPVEGLALLLGIDRFMSLARALGNVIGNCVATVVIAKMERDFDEVQALDAYRTTIGDPALQRI